MNKLICPVRGRALRRVMAPTRRRRMKFWASGLIVLLMAATAGCSGKTEESSGNSALTPQQVREIA
ncbi:hypothetical protein M2272_005923, partial [Mycobacterium frederiksbergense]